MDLRDYVKTYGKQLFRDEPFNEVDAMLFAQLCYYNFKFAGEGAYFKDLNKDRDILGAFTAARNLRPQDRELFLLVLSAKRYQNVYACRFVEDFDVIREKQFSATCFYLRTGTVVVAFRGTDGSVVGWKENLNMTYLSAIPSQLAAADYLQKVVSKFSIQSVIVTGHSKGGNLAFYASSRISPLYQYKIKHIYNFDGPGFYPEYYQTRGYKAIASKCNKYLPQTSFVGKLLVSDDYTVIYSNETYFMQHLAYTWEVEGTKFKRAESDMLSKNVGVSVLELLEDVPRDERREIVSIFYQMLQETGCTFMEDIIMHKEQLMELAKNYYKIDFKKRVKLSGFLWRIIWLLSKNYFMDKMNETIEDDMENMPNDE